MKTFIKIVVSILLCFIFMSFLKRINQYNFISFLFGSIDMGLYLLFALVLGDDE